jgi:RNase H-fold protein (predicted Holliday junction resolvase)
LQQFVGMSNIFDILLATKSSDAIICGMPKNIDRQKTKEKAVDFAFAMKTVLQQLAMQDGSAEALEAARLLSDGMNQAIPDAQTQPELHEQVA